MLRDEQGTTRSPGEIDRGIVDLAQRQGALDEEIGQWLLLAHRARIHRYFGMASFAEYVERRFGYRPRVAKDKAIVAEALEQLPGLRGALIGGARSWSAIRELVRVATPSTEADWLGATEAKTVREVERMVSGRRIGDRPDTNKDPLLEIHRACFNLTSDECATLEDAKRRARLILGPHATDGQVLAHLCESFLGKAQAPDEQPAYQVAVTVCAGCEATFRVVEGELVEVAPEIHDCAMCDGELVGLVPTEPPHVGHGAVESIAPAPPHVGKSDASLTFALRALIKKDGLGAVYHEASNALGFSLKAVSPALRRGCLARDHHHCTVPGCRNNLFIDLHHIIKLSDDGANTFENLTTLCSAHHRQHHAGYLGIEGTPSTGLVFRTARGTFYGEIPKREAA